MENILSVFPDSILNARVGLSWSIAITSPTDLPCVASSRTLLVYEEAVNIGGSVFSVVTTMPNIMDVLKTPSDTSTVKLNGPLSPTRDCDRRSTPVTEFKDQ